MNQFFLEQRGKEKMKEMQAEGLQSQAYYRSRLARAGLLDGIRRLILSHLSSRAGNKERSVKNPKSEAFYFEP
jgi:hypothetical protein